MPSYERSMIRDIALDITSQLQGTQGMLLGFFFSSADSLISTNSLLALLILRVQRLDFYCKVPLLKLFYLSL